jgi:menaquinone-9 beta-reductase
MNQESIYDVAIAGGGLAGLTMSIHLARKGYHVVVFEKEQYPFHRVCGEYISLESVDFLKKTGVDIYDLDLPVIDTLVVTAPDGTSLKQTLPLGGFGISRYYLDNILSGIAKEAGVDIKENDKVFDMKYEDGEFHVLSKSGSYRSGVAVGSFGKRSNLDVKWHREFLRNKPSKLNNFIGIKYHIRYEHPKNTIVLHNFENGYCGMSSIEDNACCLCYLTTANNLELSGNSISNLESKFLYRNPHLEHIFRNAEFIFKEPITISQVSFEQKDCVEEHVLLAGDAAGMITPLCGNGMSMAMHAGKIATDLIDAFLQHRISRDSMENQYRREWENNFSGRLRTGRLIQSMFGKPVLTNLFVRGMKPFPGLVSLLIRQTHGKVF